MTDISRAQAFVSNLQPPELSPDELAHYGVLGMKWGRRKPESAERIARQERYARNTRRKLAVGTFGMSVAIPAAVRYGKKKAAQRKAQQSDDHKTSRDLMKKPKSQLTNKELDTIINRLSKEQRLKQVNPPTTTKGKKVVMGIIGAAGTAVGVYNLINSTAGQAGIAAGKRVVDALRTATVIK